MKNEARTKNKRIVPRHCPSGAAKPVDELLLRLRRSGERGRGQNPYRACCSFVPTTLAHTSARVSATYMRIPSCGELPVRQVGDDDRGTLEPLPAQERIRDEVVLHLRVVRADERVAANPVAREDCVLAGAAPERHDPDVARREAAREEPLDLLPDLVCDRRRARCGDERERPGRLRIRDGLLVGGRGPRNGSRAPRCRPGSADRAGA